MKYRYYINDVEVFPKGEWSIEYQRNEGQIFFRRIFEGELTFQDADYDLITSLDCEIATFDIYCGGTVFWQGQFQYPYLLGFDDDSCTVVLTPEVIDEYSCIIDKYDMQISLFPAGSVIIIEDCATTNPFTIQAGRFAARLIATTASGNVNYLGHLINTSVEFGQCGLTISSSFFCESDFANGDNYAGAYGTNNYITGAANRLDLLYLVTNSGLRVSAFGGGTGCDGYTTLSFKDLEDLFRIAFNAYWFIDENGDFRVEHISYFDPAFANSDYTVGYDLTAIMDKGRSYAYRRNKYEYETGRMYDQERWSWQHYEGTEAGSPHGIDFEGYPIFYGSGENQKSIYVPGDFKEKEMALPKFWTDGTWLQAMIAGTGVAGDIDCNGWFLMDITGGTIRCENGIVSGVPEVNGHLATTRLHDNFHTYNRIFLEGDMNDGAVTTFDSAQKHKLQESIEFPVCCDEDFDPLNRIRTGLGDGEVKASVQKAQSIEVELWHEFDC